MNLDRCSVRCLIFGEEATTRLVEVVAQDENGNYVPFQGQNARDLLTDWITWRNDCPQEEIYFADAMFADKLGLPRTFARGQGQGETWPYVLIAGAIARNKRAKMNQSSSSSCK
jgi:hypothetical protein